MEYYQLSSNIIACDNFLPQSKVDQLYVDLLNNRKRFKTSEWEHPYNPPDKKNADEFYSSFCGGFDFWENWGKFSDTIPSIHSLNEIFMHQGLTSFVLQKNIGLYKLLLRPLKYHLHVICYNNGGYFGWHKDASRDTLFTFNLVLSKPDGLEGGDMLFMDDGKIIRIPNTSNMMILFPSFIDHSITPLISKDNKDVSFMAQRFSIQFWTSFL